MKIDQHSDSVWKKKRKVISNCFVKITKILNRFLKKKQYFLFTHLVDTDIGTGVGGDGGLALTSSEE